MGEAIGGEEVKVEAANGGLVVAGEDSFDVLLFVLFFLSSLRVKMFDEEEEELEDFGWIGGGEGRFSDEDEEDRRSPSLCIPSKLVLLSFDPVPEKLWEWDWLWGCAAERGEEVDRDALVDDW